MENSIEKTLSQLKSIKPIVTVPDNSLYILIAIIAAVLLLVAYLAYRYFTRVKRSRKLSTKELALKRLKALDFNDTKGVVYTFSVDGSLFVNEQNRESFNSIEKELEPYKYKKEVEKLPQDLEEHIKQFIQGVKNVS